MKAVFKIFLLLVLATLLPCSKTLALETELSPASITPGSAFLLRVTGAAGEPVASVRDIALPFSGCGTGCFVAIGSVPIDTPPGEYPFEVRAGTVTSVVSLKVTDASFPTITLTLPAGKVVLNDQDLKRAKEEEGRLEAIWEKVSPRRWSGSFLLPLQHEISTRFGTMRIMNGEMRSVHRGIDIRGSEGDAIRASNDGVVVLAEELFFGGNTVILDHGTGIYTIYMHLSKFGVAAGDFVPKDAVIGYVGSTGRASGPHLHFSVKVDTISTDPLSLISLHP